MLIGIAQGDGEADAEWLAKKCTELRIFSDADGRFNHSLRDLNGEALVISQFTLLADARRGRRPSFAAAARPETAEPLVEGFVQAMRQAGVITHTGRFGAKMNVDLVNDGPVTIVLDSDDLGPTPAKPHLG